MHHATNWTKSQINLTTLIWLPRKRSKKKIPFSFSKWENKPAAMLVVEEGASAGIWNSHGWGNGGGYDHGLCLDEKTCVVWAREREKGGGVGKWKWWEGRGREDYGSSGWEERGREIVSEGRRKVQKRKKKFAGKKRKKWLKKHFLYLKIDTFFFKWIEFFT